MQKYCKYETKYFYGPKVINYQIAVSFKHHFVAVAMKKTTTGLTPPLKSSCYAWDAHYSILMVLIVKY